MSFLFGKSKREKERERLFDALKKGATGRYGYEISEPLWNIKTAGLADDPELPFLVTSALHTMAQKNHMQAMSLGLWIVINFTREKEIHTAAVHKTQALIDTADRSNFPTVSMAANAANAIAATTNPGSDEYKTAHASWLAAIDLLAAKPESIRYAFKAAFSAAVGRQEDRPFSKEAAEKWDSLVMAFAQTNPRGAVEEAIRVQVNYDDYSERGDAMRDRARDVLDRIYKMKP